MMKPLHKMLNDYFSHIYLASQSPARLDILRKQNLIVDAVPQDCEENTDETEPGKVVESLSLLKLHSFLKTRLYNDPDPVLACDTLLWFEDKLIGKAHSEEEAYRQIYSLKGKKHQVYSGYALYYKAKIFNGWDCANVTFSDISQTNLEAYIKSGEWKGAAGSYHLFGKAVDFIHRVDGDINTVMGLPLKKIENILQNCNIV